MLRRTWWIAPAVVLTFATAPRSWEERTQAGAQSLTGTWRLLRRTQHLADGTTREHPVSVGYLIYTAAHQMCYVAMDPTRPAWASAAAPTADEALRTVTGFQAYCSRVEVHSAEGFVVHHIEVEKSPNLVGHDRKRWFTFDTPDQLRLRIDRAELRPPVVDDELVWSRMRE